MRKLLLILSLILVTGVAIGSGITRNAFIRTGYTMLSTPFICTALDTITTSETYTINITNLQQFQQHQSFYFNLTDVSGSANAVTITAYGKVVSGGAWVQIGSPISWASNSDDGYITSTTPVNYNYFKIELVADGSTQKNLLAGFEVKTSNAAAIPANSGTYTFGRATTGTITLTSQDDDANCALTIGAGGTGALTLGDAGSTTAITSSDWAIGATGIMTGIGAITNNGLITASAGATITGAAINLNASSNFAVNIGTGSTDAAVSVGGGSNTVAVNSSTWDVTTAGVASGLTKVTVTNDGDNVILDPVTDLHAIDVQINSASKFSVDTTGATVVAGKITATGGITLATTPSIYWAAGGSTVLATAGTDVACANGNRFWVEVNIPYNATITGVGTLVGSVGGTDSICVQLFNSAGTEVATTRTAGGTAAILGTAAQFQSTAFATPYAAVAGRYFVAVQFNGTTGKFRAYPIPGSKFITGTAAGTWGTGANITPGTTFTADKGPIIFLY